VFDSRTAKILLTIVAFALAFAMVYIARTVLIIFAFAILFAYLINLVVRFLQRHSLFFKNLRGPHVVEAYLAIIVVIVLLSHGLLPQFRKNVGRILSAIPALTNEVSSGEIANNLGSNLGWADKRADQVRVFLQRHHSNIEHALGEMEQAAPAAFAGLLVIPISCSLFLERRRKARRSHHSSRDYERKSRCLRLAGGRIAPHVAALHPGKSDPWRTISPLLLDCDAAIGLSQRGSAGHSRRNTRVHSGSRLDDRSRNDRRCGSPYSLALDMDAYATRSLASFDGLRYCAASYGARTGNAPAARRLHPDGWRRCRWDHRNLSLRSNCRRAPCGLPPLRFAERGPLYA